MGFFDDNDPFESIFERMFGSNGNFVEYSDSNGKKRIYQKNKNELPNNFIETKKKIYFVLDLSNMNNINVNIKESEIQNQFGTRHILEIKGSSGNILEYALPKNLHKKKFEYKFNNGILEVVFVK